MFPPAERYDYIYFVGFYSATMHPKLLQIPFRQMYDLTESLTKNQLLIIAREKCEVEALYLPPA